MTVAELIEQLKRMDSDTEVHFCYNYKDHWHTQVAPTVSTVEEGLVKYSEYHLMDKIIDCNDFYDEEPMVYKKDFRRVVILG